MKKLLLLLLLLISNYNATAQKDTLTNKSYKELTQIIREYSTDTTKVFAILDYYITKAQKENLVEREFEGLFSISLVYFQQELFAESAEAMDQVIIFRKKNNLEAQSERTYTLAMMAYLRAAQIQKAYDAADKTLLIAEKTNNTELKNTANQIIDVLDGLAENYEAIIKKNKRRLEILNIEEVSADSVEDKYRQLVFIESLLADTYLKMKIADSSAFYYQKVLQKTLENRDSCITKNSYIQLAQAEILLKDYSAAQKSLDYATYYCKPITKMDSLRILGGYGRMYFQQKKYKKSIEALEKAFNTYTISEEEEAYTLDYYKLLADAYKETGDLKNANRYFEKYVNSREKFSKVKDTIQRGIRDREISQYREVLHILEVEKAQKQTYLNYLLLFGSIVILALLFFLLKFYRNKKADEAKFEALVAKINAAKKPSEIINTKDEVLEEKTITDVSPEVTQQILDGLKKLEEKQYFLNQDCNAYNVAKKINTNTSYLSKVINTHYSKNFSTYINDLRINYAIVRLKNDVFFRSFSIQAIAEEVGYKSADSFTKYFKKDTGLNPSFYIKNIKNIT